MSARAVLILALVTVAVSFAALWLWVADQRPAGSFVGRGEPMFPALFAEQARPERIDIQTQAYRLTLQRTGEIWVAPGHGDYPVAPATANRLLAETASLRRWEAKTRRPELYDRIGVEDVEAETATSSLVRIAGAGGTPLAELLIGQRSSSIGARATGGSFVRPPSEALAWLVEGVVTLPASLGAWFGTVLQVPAPDVDRIRVSAGARPLVEGAKRPGSTSYSLDFVDPGLAPQGATANDEAFKSMTRGIVSVTVLDVRPASEVSFEADGRQVLFETAAGLRLTVRLGQAGDEPWVAFDAAAEPGSAAAAQATAIAARTEGWAFLIEPNRSAPFYVPESELLGPAPHHLPPGPPLKTRRYRRPESPHECTAQTIGRLNTKP